MADPFEAASGAIKSANEWALSAYKINNERAQADSYAEQVRAQKQAIDMKIGEEIMNDMKDIVATPGSKFKKAKIMAFDMKLQKMGMSLHPVNKAMLEDPETSNQLSQSFSKFTGGDFTPEEAADISNAVGNGKFFDIMNQRAEIANRKSAAEKMAGSEGMKDIRDLLSGPEGSGMLITRRIWDASSGDPMQFNRLLARSPEAQREIQIANKNRSNRASQTYQTEQTQKATSIENITRGFSADTLKKAQDLGTISRFPEAEKYINTLNTNPEDREANAMLQKLNALTQGAIDKEKLDEAKTKSRDEFTRILRDEVNDKVKRFEDTFTPIEVIKSLEGLKGKPVDMAVVNNIIQILERKSSVMREFEPDAYAKSEKFFIQAKDYLNRRFKSGERVSPEMISGYMNIVKNIEVAHMRTYKNVLSNAWNTVKEKSKEDKGINIRSIFPERELKLMRTGKIEPIKLTSKDVTQAKVVKESNREKTYETNSKPVESSNDDAFNKLKSIRSNAPGASQAEKDAWFKRNAGMFIQKKGLQLTPQQLKEIGL